MTQIIDPSNVNKVSDVLLAIGSQPRLEILLALGTGEACVCHLEALLGQRQAYISQHLMALREAGIITARREGRFVFYRLVDAAWLDLIRSAARLAGIRGDGLVVLSDPPALACTCPNCASVPSSAQIELAGRGSA